MKVVELLEGFHTDQRNKMLKVQTEIAKTLKVPRFKIVAYRQSDLESETGKRWLLAAPLPEGVDPKDKSDTDFHIGMLTRLVKREVLREFEKWKHVDSYVARWEGNQDRMVCTFYLPDSDGLLP